MSYHTSQDRVPLSSPNAIVVMMNPTHHFPMSFATLLAGEQEDVTDFSARYLPFLSAFLET
jgi:hypothetical protein